MSKSDRQVYVDWFKVDSSVFPNDFEQGVFTLIVLSTTNNFVWLERIEDTTSLTLMFGLLKSFQAYKDIFHIEIETVITDKKEELCSSTSKRMHPVERLMIETNVQHHIVRSDATAKMTQFKHLFNKSIMEEGPYVDLNDFETYLVDFMAYYNHPDITELLSTDIDKSAVSENIVSQKIENILKSIDDDKDTDDGGESLIRIRKEGLTSMDTMSLSHCGSVSVNDGGQQNNIKPIQKKSSKVHKKVKTKKTLKQIKTMADEILSIENDWEIFNISPSGKSNNATLRSKKKKGKKKKSIEDSFLFF